MVWSVLLTFLIFLTSISVHLAGAGTVCKRSYSMANRYVAFAAMTSGLFLAHCTSAGIFAFGFWLGENLDLGSFSKEPVMSAMDYFYFSLVNITTLGLGDIYPTGHLRFMAGVESLAGFLLISISASYIFRFLTGKMEADDGRHPDRRTSPSIQVTDE